MTRRSLFTALAAVVLAPFIPRSTATPDTILVYLDGHRIAKNYVDFGPGTAALLHGREKVVPWTTDYARFLKAVEDAEQRLATFGSQAQRVETAFKLVNATLVK